MARHFFWMKCTDSAARSALPQRGSAAEVRNIGAGQETLGGQIRHKEGGSETQGGHIRPRDGAETQGGHIRPRDGGSESQGGHIRPKDGGSETQGGHIRPKEGGSETQGGHIRPGEGAETRGGHIRQRAQARNVSFNLLGAGAEFYADDGKTARLFASEAEAKSFETDPSFVAWASGAVPILTSIDID